MGERTIYVCDRCGISSLIEDIPRNKPWGQHQKQDFFVRELLEIKGHFQRSSTATKHYMLCGSCNEILDEWMAR